jgi:hypothetical protein
MGDSKNGEDGERADVDVFERDYPKVGPYPLMG